MFPPHFPNGCRGPVFFPKDTLDCDKMKWGRRCSRCCDLAHMTERGRHMTRPPAARPNIYHLSHAERWHLFILPAPRLRNQFHPDTRLPCNANLQYAAPSGTGLPHVSAIVTPDAGERAVVSGSASVTGAWHLSPLMCRWCGRAAASSSSCWRHCRKTEWSSVTTTGPTRDLMSTTYTRYVTERFHGFPVNRHVEETHLFPQHVHCCSSSFQNLSETVVF